MRKRSVGVSNLRSRLSAEQTTDTHASDSQDRAKLAALKHNLCLINDNPAGLTHCYCRCDKCWDNFDSRCKCRLCPCREETQQALLEFAQADAAGKRTILDSIAASARYAAKQQKEHEARVGKIMRRR